jgi:hypothetical protein
MPEVGETRWSRPSQGRRRFLFDLIKSKDAAEIFLVLFFAGFVAPGFAHDPGHPESNAWFDSLKSGRGLCCSFTDGFAVSDVDWESREKRTARPDF